MRPEPEPERQPLGPRIASGAIPFLGLVLIWVLLWGQFTLLSLLTGALLGAIVSVLFYLPALRVREIIHPFHATVFLARLAFDIVVASISVSWLALRPVPVTRSAIIVVPLKTRSDVVMTFTAEALSVVPGSIVIDVDRENATLALHVLAVRDREGVERARRMVLSTERRIALAFGSLDDRERVAAVQPSATGGAS